MIDRRRGISPFNAYTSASGSYVKGNAGYPTNLLVIINRWHFCARDGHYLLTVGYCGHLANHNAVVDDFGNLMIV